MAERIVVAEFAADGSPVNNTLRQMESQTATTSRKMGSSLDALTTKMFSVRSAALKLGAAFGIGGVAFGLANALAGLGKEIIANTTFFKNLSEAATDLWRKFALGETQIERLARKAEEFWKGTGINSMQGNLAKQDELREKILTGFNAVRQEGNITAEAWRAATADIKAARTELTQLQIASAKAGVGRVTPEMRLQAGAMAPRLLPGASANLSEAELSMFGKTTGGLAALQKANEDAAKLQKTLDDISLAGADALILPGLELQHQQLVKQNEELAKWNQLMIDIHESTVVAGVALGGLKDWKPPEDDALVNWLKDLNASIDKAAVKVQLIESAMGAAIGALGSAFSSGKLDAKDFLATLMQSISQACFALSAMFAAAAIAASTGIGAAVVQGTPAQLGAAAAGFFAAGVAAGVIGGAVRGNAGGGRGHGGGGGAGALAVAGFNAGPNVTVIVQGSMFGTDKDSLARDLATLIETARGDGWR